MKHRAFDFRTAFIDLLLNFMVSLVFIFVLSSLLINPVKKQDEGLKKNAQLMIQIDWDQSTDCDVDIWVRDPNNNVVYFNQRDRGLMHIERDDLGFQNDIIDIAKQFVTGKKIENKDNQEVWVLRGNIEGEFTFNLHLYGCRIEANSRGIGAVVNLPVQAKIIKINPNYRTVYEETITIQKVWQEVTVLNFTLDSNGEIVKVNKTQRNLVKVRGP